MRLYGKRSVMERLHKNPRSMKKIYIQDEKKGYFDWIILAEKI